MSKKINILVYLIVLPNLLAYIYDRMFGLSANWLEDYQNYFKFGLLIVSIAGAVWLTVVSKAEKNSKWLVFSTILSILLIVYLYLGISIVGISF